ncbi:MAG: ABC transporter permease [Rhodospirillales bacterium]|jgi:ABC-2 type transport system permease protein|nr:ABC transporter permease [Rhodospirillales bacterium]MDP6884456.1 ABC transporter permease [Rhodospirillales bacterium]
MRNVSVIFRREFTGYFSTPLAYVFIVIFLALNGALTFYLGRFFERGQADLASFFTFHPWLYLFLIPAVAMRMWAEERKSGTIELLMTLPVSTFEVVLGKYLAAWTFVSVALILTFPMWLTVNYLGDPDNGIILASYIGSLIMAGAFLAIGACISALSKNQIIAFIVAAAVSFIFLSSGLDMVLAFFRGWTPEFVVDAIGSLSFLTHFVAITGGVIDLRDFIFFASVIALSLFINTALVDIKKAV